MKGVSDKDAQNDKKIKGNNKVVKKPLQVLHISKKDTYSVKKEDFDENQSLSKEAKTITPQIIQAPTNEENESKTDSNVKHSHINPHVDKKEIMKT